MTAQRPFSLHDELSVFNTIKDMLDYITLHGEIVNLTYTLSSTLIHPQLEFAVMANHLYVLRYIKADAAWHLQHYSISADGFEYTAKNTEFLKRAMDELIRIKEVL